MSHISMFHSNCCTQNTVNRVKTLSRFRHKIQTRTDVCGQFGNPQHLHIWKSKGFLGRGVALDRCHCHTWHFFCSCLDFILTLCSKHHPKFSFTLCSKHRPEFTLTLCSKHHPKLILTLCSKHHPKFTLALCSKQHPNFILTLCSKHHPKLILTLCSKHHPKFYQQQLQEQKKYSFKL